MKKQDIAEKSISELRVMAKKAGITAKRTWKKQDFIKALSKKKSQKNKTKKKRVKESKKKTPAKKTVVKKTVTKAEPKKAEKKIKKKTETQKAKAPVKTKIEVSAKLKQKTLAPAKKEVKGKKGISKELAEKQTFPEEPITQSTSEEMPSLPVRYGENKLASMPVTPSRIYVYWEITEDTISQYRGSLNLKIINSKTNAFFYLPVSERIGEHFINVSPAAEYTVEIGVINYKGKFVKILHSLPVETPVSCVAPIEAPPAKAAETGGLPEEFFETPESISSY